MGRAAQFGLVTPPKLKPLPPNSIDPWSERPHRWYRAYSPTIPPIGRPSPRFIIQQTRAAGSGGFRAWRMVAPTPQNRIAGYFCGFARYLIGDIDIRNR